MEIYFPWQSRIAVCLQAKLEISCATNFLNLYISPHVGLYGPGVSIPVDTFHSSKRYIIAPLI